jgi:hypothetical protein
LIWVVLAATVWSSPSAGADPPASASAPLHPTRPGLLIIEAARDTTLDFRWLSLPTLGVRCLVWPGGVLSIPDTLATGSFGVADLTLPHGATLTGISAGRRLLFTEGRYAIDRPLMLTDGVSHLFLTKGDVLIEEGRIVYRMKGAGADPRAQFLLLAGIILLTFVLIVRARSRLRNR